MTVVDGEWRTTYGNQTEITVMEEMQAIVSKLNKTKETGGTIDVLA